MLNNTSLAIDTVFPKCYHFPLYRSALQPFSHDLSDY
jgi:hypothetical protein